MNGPMRCYMDLDWSTFTCPCGASIRGDDGDYKNWRAYHNPHCDGTLLEITTDDGARVYTSKPAPILRTIADHKEVVPPPVLYALRYVAGDTCGGCNSEGTIIRLFPKEEAKTHVTILFCMKCRNGCQVLDSQQQWPLEKAE